MSLAVMLVALAYAAIIVHLTKANARYALFHVTLQPQSVSSGSCNATFWARSVIRSRDTLSRHKLSRAIETRSVAWFRE
jgi:hypothetical protein